jgi:hypothetical protein
VVAQRAAEISRDDVGTPVFTGVIAASAVGLFVIPTLYVTFQSLRERSVAPFHRVKPRRWMRFWRMPFRMPGARASL